MVGGGYGYGGGYGSSYREEDSQFVRQAEVMQSREPDPPTKLAHETKIGD